eukprot:5329901-Amphidinium_carterae.1
MVDESSFMKMLLHVLNVEAETENRSERWEEELTASGACNASGVVDVKHVVAFLSVTFWVCCSRRQQRLAAPSE